MFHEGVVGSLMKFRADERRMRVGKLVNLLAVNNVPRCFSFPRAGTSLSDFLRHPQLLSISMVKLAMLQCRIGGYIELYWRFQGIHANILLPINLIAFRENQHSHITGSDGTESRDLSMSRWIT